MESSRPYPPLWRALSFAAAWATLAVLPVWTQTSRPTQYQVEAAYLCQFPKFVQWPSPGVGKAPPKNLSLCVVGSDPFGQVLDSAVAGEAVDGRTLVARRLRSAGDAAHCQVLFVGSSQRDELSTDLAELHGAPVLTVSEIPDFAARGGMIEFVPIDRRIRFRINIDNTRRAGLAVSSQLLKVALAILHDRAPRR